MTDGVSPEADDRFLAEVIEDAYQNARSGCIRDGVAEIESSIAYAVGMMADGFTSKEEQFIGSELLKRLYGRSPDDLKDEEREEIEREDRMFTIWLEGVDSDQA